MKNKIIILTSLILLSCSQAFAIERWGKISKDFSYDNLKLTEKSASKCQIYIEVQNNSKKAVPEYKFQITAFDIHKAVEWRVTINMDAIEVGESRGISGTIHKCREDNPYKLKFIEK